MTNKSLSIILALVLSPLLLFAQENNALTCSDGIDNDGDGMIDCMDSDCDNLPNEGCAICTDGLSFADMLIEYTPGCDLADPYPLGALGVSDWSGVPIDEPQFVFLGQGGVLKLGFTNNLLTNSGDNQDDLRVFEIGPAVEASSIALRPDDPFTETELIAAGFLDFNSNGFHEIAAINGSTSGLDIDAFLPGYLPGELRFDAVEITDVIDGNCDGGTPGADIDAVCALSFTILDCEGTINGTAQVDECGFCLEPDNPNFNQFCLDCNGVINGLAKIDNCGECLEPDHPDFDQRCIREFYIPNAFSPNGDGINDRFEVYKNSATIAQVKTYRIFNRWGGLVYQADDFQFTDFPNWWDGDYKGGQMNPDVFVYYIEILLPNGVVLRFEGDVSVLGA